MQYKVPQNVDIEDRVVGPLTLRQFLIILVTIGIILVLYFLFPGPLKFFFFLLAIMIAAAGVAIAFTKYGDQNMETFLLSASRTFSSPRQRIWRKVAEPVQTMVSAEEKTTEETVKAKKSLSEEKDDLGRLAELVDSGGFLSVSQKDRVIGEIGKNELGVETEQVPDVLERTEENSPLLENKIAAAQSAAPKREPLVSEVASVEPNQDFDYPKITISKKPRV